MDSQRMEAWVRISHKVAGRLIQEPVVMTGSVMTLQQLARFEAKLDAMEDEYRARRSQGIAPGALEFDDICTHAQLWVLGAYEILRTLAEKFQDSDLLASRDLFNRLRIPLAKLEPSSKHRTTDWAFPKPMYSGNQYELRWQVADSVFIQRGELSDSFFSSFKRFCGI